MGHWRVNGVRRREGVISPEILAPWEGGKMKMIKIKNQFTAFSWIQNALRAFIHVIWYEQSFYPLILIIFNFPSCQGNKMTEPLPHWTDLFGTDFQFRMPAVPQGDWGLGKVIPGIITPGITLMQYMQCMMYMRHLANESILLPSYQMCHRSPIVTEGGTSVLTLFTLCH